MLTVEEIAAYLPALKVPEEWCTPIAAAIARTVVLNGESAQMVVERYGNDVERRLLACIARLGVPDTDHAALRSALQFPVLAGEDIDGAVLRHLALMAPPPPPPPPPPLPPEVPTPTPAVVAASPTSLSDMLSAAAPLSAQPAAAQSTSVEEIIVTKRVDVQLTTDETKVVAEVLIAMQQRGGIYQRAGQLVELRVDPAKRLPGLLRPVDELRLLPINASRARGLAAESCRFYRMEEDRDGKPEEVPCHPPDWLAQQLICRPDWPLPYVESIAENPTLRADGTIHSTPGYDAHTGNFFDADGVTFPPIPVEPTMSEARAALEYLAHPLVDFPFVASHDRSVVAAAILTMLGRPAIAGPTPPFVIRTPTPRTGKDLLTDVMTIIGTGRAAPGRSLPVGDDAELKKLLLSLGLAGVRVVSFGNCEGQLGSPVLSHAVTREVISDRMLGANRDVTVPLRPVWIFNGNNPSFKGDFGPRVVQCSMDAKVPDPQSRSGWKFDPLLPYVQRERPRLVAAGLTVLRWYCVAGRPSHGKSKKGSFEQWDDLVRGALIALGAADPLAGDADVRTEADSDVEQLTALLAAWRAAFGAREVTLADAVEVSRSIGPIALFAQQQQQEPAVPEDAKKNLAAAFTAIDRYGDRYTAASLRFFLRAHKGRPVDVGGAGQADEVLRLVDRPRTGPSKVTAWCVRSAGEK